jgi:hypothetical protein
MTDFKQPYPKGNPLHCSADWHLCSSAQLMACYNLVGRITNGGKEGRTFFATLQNVAAHFNFSYDGVRKAFTVLRKTGWLIRNDQTKHFTYVSHEEWIKSHPHHCVKRDLMPWQETLAEDPLVARLYAVSNGRLRLYENMLKRLHKIDEEALVAQYTKEIAAMREQIRRGGSRQGTSNESCLWRVVKYLQKSQQNEEVLVEKR